MRVAVIEDYPEIMDIVTIAFETAWPGSQVLGAPNATEGMQLVKQESPDVVNLDVGLPEGDFCGYDMCKELRSTSDVPIIMLAARSREVARARRRTQESPFLTVTRLQMNRKGQVLNLPQFFESRPKTTAKSWEARSW